jgi:hypothetical protein
MGKTLSATFRKLFPKAKESIDSRESINSPPLDRSLKENIPEIRSRNTFVPIHEQELNTVSSLLRGKLTVDMVNKVYDTIFHYFEQNPKR